MNTKKYQVLQSYHPTLEQILRVNPYEPTNNIDGLVDEELFRKFFLVTDNSFEESLEELFDLLLSPWKTNEIALLYGYSGAGKTTFVNEFLYRYKDILHWRYIDFHQSQVSRAVSDTEYAITQMIREQFKKEEEKYQYNALTISQNNRRLFGFTQHFEDVLRKSSNFDKETLINSTEFKDIFLLYMLLLFLKNAENENFQRFLLIFDNLDAVDIEFVTPQFLDQFAVAFNAVARLSQEEFIGVDPQFTKRYRFIFVLREGNYALVSTHFKDRIQQSVISFPLALRFSTRLYKEIILKRLEFVVSEKMYASKEEMEEIESVIEILRRWAMDDKRARPFKPFQTIIVNLFNGDYRKISDALLRTVRKIEKNNRKTWGHKHLSFRESYGITGTLIRGAIDYWFTPFKRDFLDVPQEIDIEKDGYYQPIRVVLNTVLNLSEGNVTIYENRYEHDGYCDLFSLLEKLEPLYSCQHILRTIARLFLYHKHWVNLLSIYGVPIRDQDVIISELMQLCENISEVPKSCISKCNDKLSERLRSIKIKITPAGIAYLRHIHSHFEFYGALAGTPAPLFIEGENSAKEINDNSEREKYGYEVSIEQVLRWVEQHQKIMNRFFERKLVEELGFDVDSYLRSPYCLRFNGKYISAKGDFHSTRIITSHIDYIDTFRLFLLPKIMDTETKRSINKRLIMYIRKYIVLLEQVPDPKVTDWAKIFYQKTKKIEDANYQDFSSRIHLQY